MYKIGDKIRMKKIEELLKFYKNEGMYSVRSSILERETFCVGANVFVTSMYKFCGQEFTVSRIEQGGRMYTEERPHMYLIADWCENEKPIDIIIDTERVNALI